MPRFAVLLAMALDRSSAPRLGTRLWLACKAVCSFVFSILRVPPIHSERRFIEASQCPLRTEEHLNSSKWPFAENPIDLGAQAPDSPPASAFTFAGRISLVVLKAAIPGTARLRKRRALRHVTKRRQCCRYRPRQSRSLEDGWAIRASASCCLLRQPQSPHRRRAKHH